MFYYKPIHLLPASLPWNKCPMQTTCMPADRPAIMLFSPIRGKMCNTRMHIIYVWKETKIPQVQAYWKKKQNSRNKTTTKQTNKQTNKSGTDSVRCQLFLEGTVLLRFLLLSADAEAKAAPCVPGSGVQELLMQEFPFPSTLCSAHRRLLNLPTECEVILVLCLCCEGTPSRACQNRACQSHLPLLSYAWGRRAGGAVLWQLLCTRDLSWQSYSFPSVFIYTFLSSNRTRHQYVQKNLPLEKKNQKLVS